MILIGTSYLMTEPNEMSNWSDDDDSNTAFTSSSVTIRTLIKTSYTASANMDNAPKKKKTKLLIKFKGKSEMSATDGQEET